MCGKTEAGKWTPRATLQPRLGGGRSVAAVRRDGGAGSRQRAVRQPREPASSPGAFIQAVFAGAHAPPTPTAPAHPVEHTPHSCVPTTMVSLMAVPAGWVCPLVSLPRAPPLAFGCCGCFLPGPGVPVRAQCTQGSSRPPSASIVWEARCRPVASICAWHWSAGHEASVCLGHPMSSGGWPWSLLSGAPLSLTDIRLPP